MEKSLIWLKELSETGLPSLKDPVRSVFNPDTFEDMIGALVDLEAKELAQLDMIDQ